MSRFRRAIDTLSASRDIGQARGRNFSRADSRLDRFST
jgi:hypothetical protein